MKYIIIYLLLFLVGCSGIGYGGQEGEPYQGFEPVKDGHGQIYIYRPYKKFWLLAYPEVSIDEKIVGELRNGTYIESQLVPGTYKISILENEYWSVPLELEIELAENQKLYLRVGAKFENFSFGGPIITPGFSAALVSVSASGVLQQVPEEVAIEEIPALLQAPRVPLIQSNDSGVEGAGS